MDGIQQAVEIITKALGPAGADFMSVWLPIQLALIAFAAGLGGGVAFLVRRRIDLAQMTMGWPAYFRLFIRAVAANLGTIIFAAILLVIRAGMQYATWPSRSYLLGVAISLATAWVVIVLLTSAIRNQFVNRIVGVSAWAIAALSIAGLLGPTAAALDSIAMTVGGLRITPLLILKTSALLLIGLWVASAASNFLDHRLRHASDLTPSIQVLIGKLIRLSLITFTILTVLSSVGIDFSALALFSGAVGVGVGFGLQKIVSNLVSGIILLADKSIKPGDVISVGDSFGWVDTMGARYTSVTTRDGREFLIPNEDFVTQQVVNWSHSNQRVRLEARFGVSYKSDPHQVCRAALAAVGSLPRVLRDPTPVCHLVDFGDFSIDFALRIWISDPKEGVSNIRSAVFLALWDAMKREGIEIPFPQRDLNMRTPLRVVLDGTGARELLSQA